MIVRDLVTGPRRFVELQRVLPGISTEQLRSRLNRMVADGMLTRKRYREVPPRVDYALTDRARELMPILAELAKWGYEWAWSAPRTGESVDIAAILRLAPGLLQPSPSASGVAEFKVGDDCVYTFTISADGVTVEERTAENADARIEADEAGWVAAFSPAHDRGGLKISGDRALAEALLDGLAGGVTRVARASAAA